VGDKSFLKLSSPVQYVKGIGPKRALYFQRIGVESVRDLLYLVPRRYLDYTTIRKIRDLRIDDDTTILGRIHMVEHRRTRQRTSLTNLLLKDDTGSVVVRWFNRHDLKDRFKIDDWLLASGKVSYYKQKQLVNPIYEILTETEMSDKTLGAVIPIYPLTEGLNIWDIRRTVRKAMDLCGSEIRETLPEGLRVSRALAPLTDAIRDLHFPAKPEMAQAARRRLVYDEFFFFELVIAMRKFKLDREEGLPLKGSGNLTRPFLGRLPFRLTAEQEKVRAQIEQDMARPKPMNRLLQGDVGSGKTVVALCAVLTAVENGCQAAFMAPTEILAEQHYLVHAPDLRAIGVTPVLLTSSIKGEERETAIRKIREGEAQVVIGTHALIEGEIAFKKLGLAVIDEQHRFGVMQRAALVNKGLNPDFLVLSATPIPRTMALTLYGDLDVSSLDQKPPGRGEVFTRIVREREQKKTYEFIREQVTAGRQSFVICPIIERSEKVDLKSVAEVYQEVTAVLPDFSVGVIHGRLKTAERIRIMDEFRRGQLKILVATTVIEVGVDIPNATVMIIQHPERFGLAQLHQLRGRIGRGAEKSFCFLFLDRFVSPETYDRIAFFERNRDGFALARMDMQLRGPGEILGKRQHGLPDIRIGDLESDQELLVQARDDAFETVRRDPELVNPENRPIREQLDGLSMRETLLRIG
jgi:ATP-dependent DNA helicase RecG